MGDSKHRGLHIIQTYVVQCRGADSTRPMRKILKIKSLSIVFLAIVDGVQVRYQLLFSDLDRFPIHKKGWGAGNPNQNDRDIIFTSPHKYLPSF